MPRAIWTGAISFGLVTVPVLGLRLHILVAGATFNMHTRVASAGTLAAVKD